jgi:hypothetical protein
MMLLRSGYGTALRDSIEQKNAAYKNVVQHNTTGHSTIQQ